jgi:hypothetical protein
MELRIENTEPGKPGQLFEDFLREQATYAQTTETAIKRVLAYQLAAVMLADALQYSPTKKMDVNQLGGWEDK